MKGRTQAQGVREQSARGKSESQRRGRGIKINGDEFVMRGFVIRILRRTLLKQNNRGICDGQGM